MKNIMKKSLAVLLALMMLSTSFVCLAGFELNQDAVNAHYGQYKNYVLLGDSIASGYRDEMSDNDARHNDLYMDSTYCRYEGSYADVLADAIIEDKSMTALAAPGFRTIEMRYMLEDDYAAVCDDEYLFHPSHLYVYADQVCSCHGEKMTPGSEHFRELFKKSIAEADLITLGIGGNDWGAYLGWVLDDILAPENVGDKFAAMAQEIIEGSEMDLSAVAKLLEVAHLAGALPEIGQRLPEILQNGLGNFYKNWDIMIEDIYALNPDVTLMVIGMSDSGVKGKNYDYNGVVGEAVPAYNVPEEVRPVLNTVIDFIMKVGNTPMIEGAKTFGYTYVNTDGATYVDSHPDEDGHKYFANKIIEALPDRDIFDKFTDIKPGHKYYNAVEYTVKNGIMAGTSETTFSPDEALTSGQLAAAFNAINGTDNATDGTSKVNAVKLAFAFLGAGAKGGFTGFFKGLSVYFKVIIGSGFNVTAAVTRAEAANYFMLFCK